MGAIVEYLNITQKGKLPLLQPPRQETHSRSVQIDAAHAAKLGTDPGLVGRARRVASGVIDRTVTSGGARLLERRLSGPRAHLRRFNPDWMQSRYSTEIRVRRHIA